MRVQATVLAALAFVSLQHPVLAEPALPSGDAELPLVDPSVRQLSSCRLSAITFRDENTGWLTDRCGHAFETTNGGETWRDLTPEESPLILGMDPNEPWRGNGEITFFRWLDPKTCIAGGRLGARVLRTVDGDTTWTSVATPSDQQVSSLEAVGQYLWACGSDGVILTSRDAGAT